MSLDFYDSLSVTYAFVLVFGFRGLSIVHCQLSIDH